MDKILRRLIFTSLLLNCLLSYEAIAGKILILDSELLRSVNGSLLCKDFDADTLIIGYFTILPHTTEEWFIKCDNIKFTEKISDDYKSNGTASIDKLSKIFGSLRSTFGTLKKSKGLT